MLKNIIKNSITILIICLIFFLLNSLLNNKSNLYKGLDELEFAINESMHDSAAFYEALSHTVVDADDTTNSQLFEGSYYALLIDETNNQVYASHNAHRRMYPASMTKLMTAIIVAEKLESGEISEYDVVTVSDYYDLTYDGVAPCDIAYGSQITVKNLMHGLLIGSNNYYALILADYIAGSEEAFCEMMNEKAHELGATNTHFSNPHGLDEPDHYSTAYDIFLILSEADTYEYIRNIDKLSTYSYTYLSPNGYEVSDETSATSLIAHGYVTLPSNFSVRTWKTGTTSGAGNCLAICLTKGENTYYLVASDGDSRAELYDVIIELLCLVE